MATDVIRSDIVEIKFDIEESPFDQLHRMIADLEAEIRSVGDIEVDVDTEGLEELERQAEELGDGLEDVNDTDVDVDTDESSSELQELMRHTSELEDALQQLNDIDINEIDVDSDEFKDLLRHADELEAEMRRLSDLNIEFDDSGAQDLLRRVRELREQVEGVGDDSEEAGKKGEKATDELSDSVSGLTDLVEGLAGGITGIFAALGVGAAINAVGDLQQATNKFQAQTGVSAAEMEQYSESIQNLYGQAMGESLEDVSNTLAKVNQQFKGLDPSSVEDIAYDAMLLSDTFDMDVNETLRGADALMKHMGLSSEEAFDYIAKGAQNGLNKTDELTDNIAEYAQVWGQAGFTTEEMFSVLQNGLDSGAYNLDKVNDFVKEFTISLSDGRIGENISSFSSETQKMFNQWKNGKASQKDVFNSIINDLGKMENQQEALSLASTVWSALGEDNAMSVITSLSTVNDAYSDVAGTMDGINEVRYDDINTALEALKRNFEMLASTALAPAVGRLAEFVNSITELLQTSKSAEEFGSGFASLVTGLASDLASAIPSVIEGAAGLATGLVSGLASGVPSLITTLVGAVITAAGSLVSQVPALVGAGIELIMGLLDGILSAIPTVLLQAPILIQKILNALTTAIPMLLQAGVQVVEQLMVGISQNLPVLLRSATQILLSLVSGIQTLLPMLLEGALSIVLGLVDGILMNLDPILNGAMQLILTLLDGLLTMLPVIMQAGIEIVMKLLLGVLQALPQIAETVGVMLETFVTSIVGKLPEIIAMGYSLIEMLLLGILEALPALLTAAIDIAGAFIENMFRINWLKVGWDILVALVEGIVKGAMSVASSVMDSIVGLFSGSDEEVKIEGVEAAQSFGNGIASATPYVSTQADSLASGVTSGLNISTPAFSQGTAGANSFASGLSAGLPTVSTTSAGLSNSVTSNLSVDAFSIGSTASMNYASGITASTDSAVSAASTLSSSVQTAAEPDISVDVDVNKATDSMKSLEVAANSAVTTVQGHFTKMENSVGVTLSGIVGKVQETTEKLFSAGKSIMQGLQNGILSMETSLINTASRIARNISTTINSELDINSPSGVTEDSGMNVGLGAIRGMQKMIPNIKDTSLDIGATIASGVGYANDYGFGSAPSTYNSSRTTTTNHYSPKFEFNISGVKDIEGSKRQIKQVVREALEEVFNDLGRDNPPIVEI